MHPAGRICKLSPMTILTSASHVKVTPRTAFLKKSLDSHPPDRIIPRIALQLSSIRRYSYNDRPHIHIRNDFNRF